jgi:phytoene synthase
LPGADDRGDLDELIRRVDPDRWLASRFIGDPAARADVIALLAYDHELARAPRAASNALMAEIRLTWWREALDEIYAGGPARRHPTAQALAEAVRRRSLPRAPLDAMIDGRIAVLDRTALDADEAVAWADAVAGSATVLAAMSLDPAAPPEAAAPAGRAWGLTLLRRAGLAAPETVDALLPRALADARTSARKLSVAAFPAVLHVGLARWDIAARSPPDWRRRLSLVIASATGRI